MIEKLKNFLAGAFIVTGFCALAIWAFGRGCHDVPEVKPDTHVTDSLGEEIVKRETKIKEDSAVKIVLQKHSDSLETLIKIARQKLNQKAKENDDLNAEYADAVQKADTTKILTDCDSIQKMNAVGALMIRDYEDITDSLINNQKKKDSLCNADGTAMNQQLFNYQLLNQQLQTDNINLAKANNKLVKQKKLSDNLSKYALIATAVAGLIAAFKK